MRPADELVPGRLSALLEQELERQGGRAEPDHSVPLFVTKMGKINDCSRIISEHPNDLSIVEFAQSALRLQDGERTLQTCRVEFDIPFLTHDLSIVCLAVNVHGFVTSLWMTVVPNKVKTIP